MLKFGLNTLEHVETRMAWELENFKGKRNTAWFDVNPQNIIAKWRPRTWVALLNVQLEELWIKPVTKQDIEVNYLSMLNLKEEHLKVLAEDDKQPMLIKILARNLLDKQGFDIAERMIDRGHGKAIQKEQIEIKKDITIKFEV